MTTPGTTPAPSFTIPPTEDAVRVRIAELDRLAAALVDRMHRSNARLPYHLADRAYRAYSAEHEALANERTALARTLPPEPEPWEDDWDC